MLMGQFRRAITLAILMVASDLQPAWAEKIEANCTGMLEFDIYTIDTEEPVQEVEKIGTSEVAINEDSIVLTGAFGEYKFDLKAGTLYYNGGDTGVYCTYSRKE